MHSALWRVSRRGIKAGPTRKENFTKSSKKKHQSHNGMDIIISGFHLYFGSSIFIYVRKQQKANEKEDAER